MKKNIRWFNYLKCKALKIMIEILHGEEIGQDFRMERTSANNSNKQKDVGCASMCACMYVSLHLSSSSSSSSGIYRERMPVSWGSSAKDFFFIAKRENDTLKVIQTQSSISKVWKWRNKNKWHFEKAIGKVISLGPAIL